MMAWEGFTAPTRSRAIARTSFDWSNPSKCFFFLGRFMLALCYANQ